MHIVSQNSDADMARRHALQAVEHALCDLTANLLQVVRGVGEPSGVDRQALTFVETVIGFRELTGDLPSSEDFARILAMPDHADLRDLPGTAYERAYAERQIVSGSLQIAASRLLSQPTQEAAGHFEMYSGCRTLQRLTQS
jgi:hypothetical protein